MEKLCSKLRKLLNRETILYLIFGVVTTAVNLAVFAFCDEILKLSWKASNITAWIIAVAVAFITNKIFVFESRDMGLKTVITELFAFAGARVFSLLFEYAALFLLIDVLSLGKLLSKAAVNVLVIIINYVLSKLIIFKKRS